MEEIFGLVGVDDAEVVLPEVLCGVAVRGSLTRLKRAALNAANRTAIAGVRQGHAVACCMRRRPLRERRAAAKSSPNSGSPRVHVQHAVFSSGHSAR